ncbi:hypothetical protein MMC13_006593 [Lambiella insularis]|nr:hypothetical protein [Lambiella insularis]
MLINQNTAISTSKILLVPYEKHHVPTYHEWMQDAEIQEATASEPLSLDEEYAMQSSWRHDPDKLTYIACLPLLNPAPRPFFAGHYDDPSHMLGDVNLFLTESGDGSSLIGEIELMIAVKSQQGHGYGRASLLAFLRYVVEHEEDLLEEFERDKMGESHLGLMELRVKIGEANVRSVGLFESVGFEAVGGEADYFGERELRMRDGWRERVGEVAGRFEGVYEEVGYGSAESEVA